MVFMRMFKEMVTYKNIVGFPKPPIFEYRAIHKLSTLTGKGGEGGLIKCQHLSTRGGGDQRLVNVDNFELFIRLINSNTKTIFFE